MIFAEQNNKYGKRIGLIFNYPVGGKRIFKTGMTGGYFGIDIKLDF